MALLSPVEVNSGGDRPLLVMAWATWLTAVGSLMFYSPRMPLVMLIICIAALLFSIPRRTSASFSKQHLQLHADGRVHYGDVEGTWQLNTWRSPWYTVISIKAGSRRWNAWISASRNSQLDYRRLGVWCRFSPQEQQGIAKSKHSAFQS